MSYGQASFEIRTPRDFYDILVRPQYRLFRRSYPKSAAPSVIKSRHAALSVLCAYHMYDWVHKGQNFSMPHFQTHHPGKHGIGEMFEIARKLTNGTKHFRSRVISRVDQSFSPDFSREFAQTAYPALLVEKDDGTELQADVLLKTLIDFWDTERANGAF